MKHDVYNKPANNIDDYLAAVPEESRGALEMIRKTIKSSAPKAIEKISYGMPVFYYLGMLVGFAAFKNHLSFYIMSYKVMDTFKEEIEPYLKAKATLHFSADKPLPKLLVKNIVIARIKENEEKVNKNKPLKPH